MAIALFVTLLAAPGVAGAGTSGALNGTVADRASGAPLANVMIVVTSPQEREQSKTDQRGNYVLVNLQPGAYTVTAIRVGYNPYSAVVAVRPGSETTLKIVLTKSLSAIAVDCFCPQPLMQPTIVADEYRVKGWNAPSSNVVESAMPLLLSVAGITFGSEPRMVHSDSSAYGGRSGSVERTLFVLAISVVLALPMITAIESGFLFRQSHELRRALYAIAAVWYAIFLILFWHASPAAAWFYVIPQLSVGFV